MVEKAKDKKDVITKNAKDKKENVAGKVKEIGNKIEEDAKSFGEHVKNIDFLVPNRSRKTKLIDKNFDGSALFLETRNNQSDDNYKSRRKLDVNGKSNESKNRINNDAKNDNKHKDKNEILKNVKNNHDKDILKNGKSDDGKIVTNGKSTKKKAALLNKLKKNDHKSDFVIRI
ncbi:hypothetical protein MHBO_003590 [Bonamia ostreae]|uniref:Uncharacterized protein n=1 Tax=Bonamia ostreae TaxID=126728 RepID=A0ABV2AQX7_9EUKA